MDPLASTRVSLRWPPLPANEDCHVLVLSGRSGFFLDVRVKRDDGSTQVAAGGVAEPVVGWATAGWKELLPSEVGEEHPRARFTAVIDSRSPAFSSSSSKPPPAEDSPPDEGSFETLPNGDVLERGEMLNSATGQVQPYEEVWRRLPLVNRSEEGERVRVLILEAADQAGKAFIGQVGDRELGMSDGAAGFGIVWREKRAGGWEVIRRNKAGEALPSLEGVSQSLRQGDTVDLGGRTWRVVESS
ncbi:hypothetical protein JCM6882_007463 [Rhodosporidiobolus microsporus]